MTAVTQLPVVIAGYKVPADSPSRIRRRFDKIAKPHPVGGAVLAHLPASRLPLTSRRCSPADSHPRQQDPSLFYAFAAVKPGKDRQAVEDTLFTIIERLGREGPTEEELSKARNQVESELVFSLEEVQGRAEVLGAATLVTGDPAAAVRRFEQLRAVTADDVRRVVAAYLTPQRRTVVWLLPQERSGS